MDKKTFIEKARNNQTIMEICHAEYLANYGKFPPENWQPSEEEIKRVARRAGISRNNI